MKRFACLVLLVCLAVLANAAADDEHHGHHDAAEQLGTVSFPTSCSPAVQQPFQRAVALMHSFWYEEAEKQFSDVAAADPRCAIAHWGIALSLYHQLWDRPQDPTLKRGWEEIQKAQTIGAKTDRERDYINALAQFYRDPASKDHQQRATAYAQAMEKLYAKYPQDREAGAFDALSLLASAPLNDRTSANERKAVAVLMPLFRQDPNHPGLAHYIIHACDSPQMASMGLEAARRYSQIASSSPHAVHMPSHIFARLGLWQDDIESNLKSVALTRQAAAMHMGGASHQLHAMDFLVYAYLQTGEDEPAKQIVDGLPATIAEIKSGHAHDVMMDHSGYALAQFPALYALEMHHWSDAAALEIPAGIRPLDQVITVWARVVGAGHLRNAEAARKDLQQFDSLVESVRKSKNAYLADLLTGVPRDEMAAWVAFTEKKNEDAIRLMRRAADRQDAEGKGEVEIPAREMLADMLLEMNRPTEALAEYEQSMKVDPNRFNGLYGAARSAELAGEMAKASSYYATLVKNCAHARSDRPELARARTVLAKYSVRTTAATNNR
ncbi:MAG: tetratricopeptide repeat protein [Terriglobales bacterium]